MKKIIFLIIVIISTYSYVLYRSITEDTTHSGAISSITNDIKNSFNNTLGYVEKKKESLKDSSVAKSLEANKALTDKTKEVKEEVEKGN